MKKDETSINIGKDACHHQNILTQRNFFRLSAASLAGLALSRHLPGQEKVDERCTKIIDVPILKNAGPTVTLCLKNLSYGSLSNTGRLHKLWLKSVAEPCAFPALRDKIKLGELSLA